MNQEQSKTGFDTPGNRGVQMGEWIEDLEEEFLPRGINGSGTMDFLKYSYGVVSVSAKEWMKNFILYFGIPIIVYSALFNVLLMLLSEHSNSNGTISLKMSNTSVITLSIANVILLGALFLVVQKFAHQIINAGYNRHYNDYGDGILRRSIITPKSNIKNGLCTYFLCSFIELLLLFIPYIGILLSVVFSLFSAFAVYVSLDKNMSCYQSLIRSFKIISQKQVIWKYILITIILVPIIFLSAILLFIPLIFILPIFTVAFAKIYVMGNDVLNS